MFEAFKKIKKENPKVYKDRLITMLLDIGEFLIRILLFILILIGLILFLIGVPLLLVLTILEFILVPAPYFILSGDRYYNVTKPLIAKYIDLLRLIMNQQI